jgi:hypothetical protein
MRAFPRPRIRPEALVFALMVSLALPLQGEAEERIEGVVRDTVVTHCDASRQGGCAGTLTLERRSAAGIETLAIKVPLGTPISRESGILLLHSLEGRTVVVTQTSERSARVARAVEVVEPAFSSPLAEPASSPRLC